MSLAYALRRREVSGVSRKTHDMFSTRRQENWPCQYSRDKYKHLFGAAQERGARLSQGEVRKYSKRKWPSVAALKDT